MSHIVVDLSVLDDMEPPEPTYTPRRVVVREAAHLPATAIEAMMPTVSEATAAAAKIPPAKLEAAKATFIASGGNIAEVSRQHGIRAKTITKIAAEQHWPVYGDGYTDGEKSRRTSLKRLAALLEQQMFDLATALGVERKDLEAELKHGMNTQFVAPLNQRSQAFATVFDRYMRVMTLLEPELFANDNDPSNPVASRLRSKSPDAPGGLEGIDRRMADFAARVAVSTLEAQRAGTHTVEAETETVDAEVVDADG